MTTALTADRIKETSIDTGNRTITLDGPEFNYISFTSVFPLNSPFPYAIVHQTSNEWEVGYGQMVDVEILERLGVYSSTNGNNFVDFSVGIKDVFCTLPAELAVLYDVDDGNLNLTGTVFGNFNGSLLGNASTANTSSFSISIANISGAGFYPTSASTIVSSSGLISSSYSSTASYAVTAAFALQGGGGSVTPTGSFTGSFTGSLLGSASYAVISTTASYLSGNINFPNGLTVTGSITASAFSGSIQSSSFASYSYTALTASNSTTSSYALVAQNVLGSITSASYALVAQNVLGSITSASYAGTASAANNFFVSGTETIIGSIKISNFTASVVNITITGSIAQTGSQTIIGVISASAFSGSIASASFASSSYTTLTASNANTASYALVAQNVLGSITSASYAGTASAANNFFTSGTTTHIGNTLINNFTASVVDVTITGSISQTGSYTTTGVISASAFSGLIQSASYATTASSVTAIAGSNIGAGSYSGSFTGSIQTSYSGSGAISISSGSIAITISGSAPRLGTTILSSGTKKVTTAAITSTSRVFLSTRIDGGTVGNLSYSGSNGDGFTINSSNIADASTVDWIIFDGF